MTEQTTEPMVEEVELTVEEDAPIEQVTIEILKAKGSVKTPRKATVIVLRTGMSEKYGTVRLTCSPNGNTWYVVTEHPVEGGAAPAPLRHEKAAVKLFAALCQAE